MIACWVDVEVIVSVESIARGDEAVVCTAQELESEKAEEGVFWYHLWSVYYGMKSESEGSREGFQKNPNNTSAITFVSPLRSSIVQTKWLRISSDLACFPMRSYCLGKAYGGLSSVIIVNLYAVSTDLKCTNIYPDTKDNSSSLKSQKYSCTRLNLQESKTADLI